MPSSTALDLPPYRIAGQMVFEHITRITILCECKEFRIELSTDDENVRGTRLETEYNTRVSKFIYVGVMLKRRRVNMRNEDAKYDQFCMWIIRACIPLIKRLITLPDNEGAGEGESITLERLAFPEVYSIKMGPRKGNDKQIAAYLAAGPNLPSEWSPFQKIPISDLGDELIEKVKIIPADEIIVSPTPLPPDELEDAYFDYYKVKCDVPRLVHTQDGEIKFFKKINDQASRVSIREISKLHKIAELGLPDRIRVPKLYGVVVSSDRTKVLGILEDWLPFGLRNLENDEFRAMKDMHAEWEKQALDIIDVLHSNDIVWNTVQPENILIDHDLNVWIINFGGGILTDGSEGNKCRSVAELKELFSREHPEWDINGVKKIFKDCSRRCQRKNGDK